MTRDERARREQTEQYQEESARDLARSVLDAVTARPGDGALDCRELLRAELVDALREAFEDGMKARREEEADEDWIEDTAPEAKQEPASWLTPAQREALQLVAVYTDGTFILQQLDGPDNGYRRASVLAALTSASVPKGKAGVNALRDALYAFAKPQGETPAARELDFRQWAKAQVREAVTA